MVEPWRFHSRKSQLIWACCCFNCMRGSATPQMESLSSTGVGIIIIVIRLEAAVYSSCQVPNMESSVNDFYCNFLEYR